MWFFPTPEVRQGRLNKRRRLEYFASCRRLLWPPCDIRVERFRRCQTLCGLAIHDATQNRMQLPHAFREGSGAWLKNIARLDFVDVAGPDCVDCGPTFPCTDLILVDSPAAPRSQDHFRIRCHN